MSSEVYAVVSWRIQVILDVTLRHAVSGGQCVLGTRHLHLPRFRGHEECQGALRGGNVQARCDQWTDKWWASVKMGDRLGFTIGGVLQGGHNWWTVEGPSLAVDPQGSRCMNGERMEMVKKWYKSREQCPLLEHRHQCGWYVTPMSPAT